MSTNENDQSKFRTLPSVEDLSRFISDDQMGIVSYFPAALATSRRFSNTDV